MKILILGAYSPSLVNFRGQLLEEMVRAGHEVHAAAPGLDSDLRTRGRLAEMMVTPHEAPFRRTGLNPIADLRSLVNLIFLLRSVRPDAILSYTVKPVIWGTLAAAIAGVPRRFAMITGLGYAFTRRSQGLHAVVGRLVDLLYRLALRRATGIIFQNEDDAALFREMGLTAPDTPVSVVAGSGVDLGWFARADFPTSGSLTFLMIARLLRSKGVLEFAEASGIVKQRYPNARFVLVGPIEEGPDAIPRATIERLGEDGVEWLGESQDVRPCIAGCHVYVLPSYREGTPRTVLEAMALGRPIITTDVPGCRQTVIDARNGYLVPARSSEALAHAMARFVETPGLAESMGAASRSLVEERFDVHAVNRDLMRHMGLA